MILQRYTNFNEAIRAALAWLQSEGATQLDEAYEARRGTFGMRTLDKSAGYRVEFDEPSSAHINVWSHNKHGPHFQFPGNAQAVKAVWRQLFYWDPKLKRKTIE